MRGHPMGQVAGRLRQAGVRRGFALLVIASAGLMTAGAVEAAERVALVLGMSKYRTISPLKNSSNDAAAIAKTLTTLGFETEIALDLSMADLTRRVQDFSFKAETADVALVYYAGHGVEVGGENYLVPVDIAVANAGEIGSKALGLKSLLAAVDKARKLRIVILDSCRNNPFPAIPAVTTVPEPALQVASAEPAGTNDTRGLGRVRPAGLAPPTPERGMMVIYAAKDGEVAMDGSGDNSPFATALIELLPSRDIEIGLLFRKIRDRVMEETGNRQQPHFYGSLSGVPFFLAGSNTSIADGSDKVAAWKTMTPDQTVQLAALAEEGDTRALIGLGAIALSPDAGSFAPEKAFQMFSKAAEAGDAEAMFELAKLYEKGIGTKQNMEAALTWYRKSADLDFADAINDLGFFTFQGTEGLPRDPAKAISLFQRAADLRHPQAMFNVAALIDDGTVPGKGPEDAAGYLYQSLRSGVQAVLDQMTTRPEAFKPATRKALQALLAQNKFYEGTIDGAIGPGTQRSMRLAFGQSE